MLNLTQNYAANNDGKIKNYPNQREFNNINQENFTPNVLHFDNHVKNVDLG